MGACIDIALLGWGVRVCQSIFRAGMHGYGSLAFDIDSDIATAIGSVAVAVVIAECKQRKREIQDPAGLSR